MKFYKKQEPPEDDKPYSTDLRQMHGGVTITWLAAVFHMDRNVCIKRLAGCPELRRGVGGSPLFDLAQAASYLVKPRLDIREYMKSLRPSDLPPYMQSEFWEAQNKRQKWEENAGDLWRTEKVRDAYTSMFTMIKETINLWVDSIDRKTNLNPGQRAVLTQLVDGLQNEIHKKVIEYAGQNKLKPQISELEDVEKTPGRDFDKDDHAKNVHRFAELL
jgi:hypothetical protein